MHNIRFSAVLACLPFIGAAGALAQSPASAPSPVVLNEIMYHPANDLEELQYIELHNRSDSVQDLSGWRFSDGVEFKFPDGTQLAPKGYGLIVKDAAAAVRRFRLDPSIVLGTFEGNLSNSGEKLVLRDERNQRADSVEYGDRFPWPAAADGYGSSLERVCPDSSAGGADNWEPSDLPKFKSTQGSPGRQNNRYQPNPPPSLRAVNYEPKWPAPGQSVTVTAMIEDPDGIASARVRYVVAASRAASQEQSVAMDRVSGDGNKGVYRAELPGAPSHHLVRFRIQAFDERGSDRILPSPHETAPSFSYMVFSDSNTAKVPFGFVFNYSPVENGNSMQRFNRPAVEEAAPTRGDSAFVYLPPEEGEPLLFDYIRVTRRSSGFKLRFRKEDPLLGMKTVNIIFEQSPRQVLSEHLSFELFRRAGVPTPYTDHIRIWMDDRLAGYHLFVEQPNETFLERHGKDADGNLYKLLWYGNDVIGKHEKKTNTRTGHEDLLEALNQLRALRGKAEWDYIQARFDAPEFIRYFVVNMCVSNWDGFFNNYFVYRAPGSNGKWQIYPWDEDKTWGDYDGASSRYDWYELPLDFGMEGADQPGWMAQRQFGGGPFGSTAWWRPPGYFSGPLLANPFFREQFLRTLYDFCQTEFTQQKFLPAINGLETRLRPEIEVRARAMNRNPDYELRRFESDIESFRRQLIHRREFILKNLKF